jgi:hypothetical protein
MTSCVRKVGREYGREGGEVVRRIYEGKKGRKD